MADNKTHSDCQNAKTINENNLFEILKENSKTVFGKEHGFSEISSIDDYRKKVPLSDYEYFSSYIKRMYENNEENVLISERPVCFCATSGTEGEPKHIPITQKTLDKYSDVSERYKNEVMKSVKGARRLFINTFHTDPDAPVEKSLLFSEIYNRYLYQNGFMDMGQYAGKKPLLFEPESRNMFYAKAWAALAEENIVLIEAAFLYDVLQFFGYLEYNWKTLLFDIENKNITDKGLPEGVKKALLEIEISRERIDFLKSEFQKGFEGIAQRIWKNLRLVCGISTKAYYAEDAALKKYTSDIPLHYLAYCSSECYIGTPVSENDFGYILLPTHAFYEFIPYGADEEETLLPFELQKGRLYEIVITNFSGLYRYRLGDVLRVSGFYGESPVLEFEFRKNMALNIAGEKLSVSQLEKAVKELKSVGISIREFCFYESLEKFPGRYAAVMTADQSADEKMLSFEIDKALKKLNSDYLDLRELKHIEAPEIKLLSAEQYADFQKRTLPQNRHNKPVHIISRKTK